MSSLGIYFGEKIVNIVQSQGKKVLASAKIPNLSALVATAEGKVPEELKIIAVLKEEFRRSKIEAKEAVLCLSGDNLIIRTFDMPVMPHNEMLTAVNFEAKKYSPFKIEELISDFQVVFDKLSHRNRVLYVGIKKDVLDKYLSIFKQLDIKITAIEYSGFSLLRIFRAANINTAGYLAMLSVDIQEADEANFIVLENGFPLFSRDISLSSKEEVLISVAGAPEKGPAAEEKPKGATALEKLKTEIRVSLDYYNRKFPSKNIKNIILTAAPDNVLELKAYLEELGLQASILNIAKSVENASLFSLSFLKSYTASLFKLIKSNLKINLLLIRQQPKAAPMLNKQKIALLELFEGLKLDFKIVILAAAICGGAYLLGYLRSAPLRQELNSVMATSLKISNIPPNASYQELQGLQQDYSSRLKTIDGLVKDRLCITSFLDKIPQILPKGMWLTSFTFNLSKEKATKEILLKGSVYLGDADRELSLVNAFVSYLKVDVLFSQYFKNIAVNSISRSQGSDKTVTDFDVSCKN